MHTTLSLRRYADETRSHHHDDWHQLVLARHGVLEMEVQGTGGRVDGSCLALVPAGRRHGFRPCGAGEFLVLDWPVERATTGSRALFEQCRRSPFLRLRAEHGALGDFLAALATAGDKDSALVAAGAALLLAALAEPGNAPVLPARLRMAMDWLQRHLGANVTTGDAARAAGLSTSRLHTLFREWLDGTPRAWLAAQRLEHARRLLASPGARHGDLERLAGEVGYADASTLARAFRARFGESPAAYRRRVQARQ